MSLAKLAKWKMVKRRGLYYIPIIQEQFKGKSPTVHLTVGCWNAIALNQWKLFCNNLDFFLSSSKYHSLYKVTSGSPEARRTVINRGAAWASILSVGAEILCTDMMLKINQKKKGKLLQNRKRSILQAILYWPEYQIPVVFHLTSISRDGHSLS